MNKTVGFLIVCVLLAGCGNGNGLWTTKDSWYTGYPSDHPWLDEEQLKIQRECIMPVCDLRLDESITLLSNVQVLEIDLTQAQQLVGVPNLDPSKLPPSVKAESRSGKLKPYLVRAVVLWEGTGAFSAYWKDSSLWINHGCLGRRAAPMKRRPLVIFLEKKPTDVYNDVSMAE